MPSIAFTSGSADLGTTAQQALPPNTSVTEVVVVSPSVNSSVMVSSASACNSNEETAVNYVQDTGLINLNQPAECFTLQNTVLAHQPTLIVKTSASPITVAVQQPLVVLNKLLPTPSQPSSVPLVPVTAAGIIIVLTVLGMQVTRKLLPRLTVTFVPTLSLSQLQVRRC